MRPETQKPPPIRKDLEIVPQYYRGQLCYVAKDPVTLSYYRLGEVEYIVLKCFQDGMGVEEIQREVRDKTGKEVSSFEVHKFANQLRQSDLLKSKGMGDVRRLARNKRKAKKQKIKRALSNYLFITIPLWDPDTVLNRLLPYFRFFLKKIFLLAWLAITGVALWIIVDNFGVLISDAFSVLSGWNLAILSGVVVGKTFFHEMGHALTCKHYGGEVHAIGPAFLVFQPCMFTDTSDAWLLPNKWDRIVVTGAGIFTDIMMASVAAIVWISSDPGFIKQLSYTVMLAASVHTILFNANPLLRFDGYYVLSDLMEIPNLRMKSEQFVGRLFDRYVLGLEAPARGYFDEEEKHIYFLYGVARICYKTFIVLSIGFFLYTLFEPLGVFMWITSFYGMLLVPMWRRGENMARQYNRGNVKARYLLVLAALVALAAGLWFVPIDYTIEAPAVLSPGRRSVLRTAVPGHVERVLVAAGDRVEAGRPLVRMSNPELVHRAEQVRHRLREAEVRLRKALVDGAAEHKMLQHQKNKLAEELQKLEKQVDRLVLRAPHDGVVVNLQRAEIQARSSTHQFASFPPKDAVGDLKAFEDTTVAAGTGILGVAATERFYFETFVYEHDVSYLSSHDPMVCMLLSGPLQEFELRVQAVTPVDVKTIENMGITLADVGYIPVRPSQEGGQEPLVTLYRVRSRPVRDERLRWGQTGKARITYGRGPMGKFFFGRLVRALRLRLQRT